MLLHFRSALLPPMCATRIMPHNDVFSPELQTFVSMQYHNKARNIVKNERKNERSQIRSCTICCVFRRPGCANRRISSRTTWGIENVVWSGLSYLLRRIHDGITKPRNRIPQDSPWARNIPPREDFVDVGRRAQISTANTLSEFFAIKSRGSSSAGSRVNDLVASREARLFSFWVLCLRPTQRSMAISRPHEPAVSSLRPVLLWYSIYIG